MQVPSEPNGYLFAHAELLLRSYRQWTGRELLEGPADDPATAGHRLYDAPFFVASHDARPDPVLNYGNRVALELFEMTWEEFTSTPSRLTAEAPEQEERARLLRRVAEHGFIDDYSGIRIAKSGRRFRIHRATVWNLVDSEGRAVGQAATFSRWDPVS